MKMKYAIAIVVVVIVTVAAAFAFLTYGTGTLQVKLTDPPDDWNGATQVYLNYSAIEVHRANASNDSGWFTVTSASSWINLTKTLDVNETVGSVALQAGKYNLLRFRILEAKVTVGGVNFTASVPSGELLVAITRGGVQVNAGQTSTLLIELDLRVDYSEATGYRIVPAVKATPV